MSNNKRLRLITYVVKDYPIELFELYKNYLEGVFGVEAHLIVESRWDGPPKERTDLFATGEVDIGFMCSSSYLKLTKEQKESIELLPVGAVHDHPKGQGMPVYFADVIVHKSKSKTYRALENLRGHKWAYNHASSMSGNYITLDALKRMGANASFFGHILKSNSHMNSIRMVLDASADAAAVNSVCLDYYRRTHPESRDNIHVLASWGPLSVYAITVSSSISAEMKQKLAQAFLSMNHQEPWTSQLHSLGVHGFVPVDDSLHDFERQILSNVKDETLDIVYY